MIPETVDLQCDCPAPAHSSSYDVFIRRRGLVVATVRLVGKISSRLGPLAGDVLSLPRFESLQVSKTPGSPIASSANNTRIHPRAAGPDRTTHARDPYISHVDVSSSQ